jgi:hypothetical protein
LQDDTTSTCSSNPVGRLEAKFVYGYRDGDRVFYVSTMNDKRCPMKVPDELKDAWDPH